jgi:radical SAM superfamily enzyme YgiQ (UPF0313 family)
MDMSAFGVRSISSYIKTGGHRVRLIFIPDNAAKPQPDRSLLYSPRLLEGILRLCGDTDLVGLSFMTHFFDRAVQLTSYLKDKLKLPIIWGGIHPTSRPEESLRYADIVCIGEGEEGMLELLNRMENGTDYLDTPGFYFKSNGTFIKNSPRSLIQDLNNLPFQDYTLEDEYVYDKDKEEFIKVTAQVLKKYAIGPFTQCGHYFHYKTMIGRGCPHSCTFCCNDLLRAHNRNQNYLRFRQPEHVIEELCQIKNRFPFINAIYFSDDTLFGNKTEEIKKFSHLYKERVGLPFGGQCSPLTITREKMKWLVDAGLAYIEMGIQTGAEKSKKLYNRPFSNQKVIQGVSIIKDFCHKLLLPPDYHVILDNPWETPEETIETLNLLLKIPKPYGLCPASLIFFPETGIYHLAKKEGLIKDELKEIYRKDFKQPADNYINFLFYLCGFRHFPTSILRLLSNRRLVSQLHKEHFNRIFRWLRIVIDRSFFMGRGLKTLLRGDWSRIFRHLHRPAIYQRK